MKNHSIVLYSLAILITSTLGEAVAQDESSVYRCPGPPILYTDKITLANAIRQNCKPVSGAPITPSMGYKPDGGRMSEVGGVGASPCLKFIELRQKESSNINVALHSWLLGYFSGYNQFAAFNAVEALPPQEASLSFLDGFCQRNSSKPVKAGADALIWELGGKPIHPDQFPARK